MKIIGKNSIIYWLRIPFSIYIILFLTSSLWMFVLMGIYVISGPNQFISEATWNNSDVKIVQFHYPYSKMVLATENSVEGLGIAFLGLASICFVLFASLKLVYQFSRDNIFTGSALKYLSILGFGMIIFGILQLSFDLVVKPNSFDLTPPFFLVLIGIVILIIKEIFAKGKILQDENELTI